MDPSIPQSPTDVLMLPMLALLFGAVVYGAGIANGRNMENPPKYRWVGVGLLAIALILGIETVYRLFGPLSAFYRAMIGNRKLLLAHYIALILPLLALAAVPVAEAWHRRTQRDMR